MGLSLPGSVAGRGRRTAPTPEYRRGRTLSPNGAGGQRECGSVAFLLVLAVAVAVVVLVMRAAAAPGGAARRTGPPPQRPARPPRPVAPDDDAEFLRELSK